MGKINVDFINTPQQLPHLTGIYRVICEVSKRLQPYINRKDVYYKGTPSWLPYGQSLLNKFFYSVQKIQHRKNAIKHIWSQDQAYILRYIKLPNVIVMCYDLIPYIFPYHGIGGKFIILVGLSGMLKANRIIVNSKFTKEEVVKYLNYPEEKITIVQLGVDSSIFKPMRRSENFSQKYLLQEDTKRILYVGNNHPRRNLPTLIEAFYKVKKSFHNVKLFIAGEDVLDRFPEKVRQEFNLSNKIQQFKLQKDVFLLDYVEDSYLPQLYNEADVFVFPSSYEGFGLPLLEAMASGVPVITGNTSSLPEVVGDAGLKIDTTNVEAMASAIENVLNDNELRNTLIKKGLERVKKFSWERSAKKILHLYGEMANE